MLVALSGMDGAGKSTAALELAARLDERGHPAVVSWSRLGTENEILDLISRPLRRLLRRRGSVADPVATAESPEDPSGQRHRGNGSRGPVEWVWVVIVAAVNARSCRRTARLRRAGLVVICDRWLPDALVDLEIRYGHHRMAERVLRRGLPTPELAILLELDARTAARRKPGDQAERVLAAMAGRYSAVASSLGFPPTGAGLVDGRLRVDATGDRSEVAACVERPALGWLRDQAA